MRSRLDLELLKRGLVNSREEAQRLIADKKVLVDGAVADKPARRVAPSQNLLITEAPKFVSRAGIKLEGALQKFKIDPKGLICLDAGSSTGGFSDCLLQLGCKKVTAVDVGSNQLHETVRDNPRVAVYEQTDIRDFAAETTETFDLVVADLSFISLTKVIPSLNKLTKSGGQIVVLVKPQFEAGRAEVSKGAGIISDPEIWERVKNEVAECAQQLGLVVSDSAKSDIKGTKGNVEFFLLLARP